MVLGLLFVAFGSLDAVAQEETPFTGPRVGKMVWDIALGNTPLEFNQNLEIIRDTYRDLISENIKPDMILLFRGHSVRWLLRRSQQVWSQEALNELIAKLQKFRRQPGVQFVADLPASKEIKLTAKDLLPGVKVVKNAYIALMRYNVEGYTMFSSN